MISRRDKLLSYPWDLQRYKNHKAKVIATKAAVDVQTPPVYLHIITKHKKLYTEKERLQRIETENMRLLQKLGDIMSTKRIQNFWTQSRPKLIS